jgi:ribosome maturation factor RimP
MSFKAKVTELLNQALEENPSLFLIELSIGADHSIRVLLDGDHGVTLEDCMQVSRKIEHNLDREQTDFSIEVSSCGVGTPLVIPRQFKKNIDRKLEVIFDNGKQQQGTLVKVDEKGFAIRWKTREPKPIGKGKVTVTKTTECKYDAIQSAKVIVNI